MGHWPSHAVRMHRRLSGAPSSVKIDEPGRKRSSHQGGCTNKLLPRAVQATGNLVPGTRLYLASYSGEHGTDQWRVP